MKTHTWPEFIVERNDDRCIRCQVCVNQCTFDVHSYDAGLDELFAVDMNCVGCQRCQVFCPTNALTIRTNPTQSRPNANWRLENLFDVKKQAESGGIVLTGMGNDKPFRIYWDHLVLNASQVTNPSIDPLREPMELRTYLGRKPDRVVFQRDGEGQGEGHGSPVVPIQNMTPLVAIETPLMFSAMSYGAISYNTQHALMRAAQAFGTMANTGEGGWPREFRQYKENVIVQVASGRFGVDLEYLNDARFVEIKVGQGAKPGIGGHLPGEKVTLDVSRTRMIPEGSDAISPAPHHDIYSIEDLGMLIHALKEATRYEKPVAVKIAAVHNVSAIASGIVRAGADIVVIDGLRGGTGAAPKVIRDNVGIPIELALAQVDQRLRKEGIRHQASLVVAGGFRSSGDVIKAIALGADAVYIGTAAFVAIGCTLCQKCYTGKCAWGITSNRPEVVKRLNPDHAAERLENLLRAWSREIKEMLGGMGINSVESLRGNRLHLRAVGLEQWEMDALGVKGAGL
ncbi:MAG TPA: glutamate synthase-related protein [Symbiobacteriaceae bacterium]|nr:glutamate synthase-related protein [Symbiobacteriaceae bacterium]